MLTADNRPAAVGGALPSRQRFATILAVIGATDVEREQAFQLYQIANTDTAVIEHADAPSAKYLRFRLDEAEAIKERMLDTVVVPGPLQTPEYITAIARGRRRLLRSADWEKRAGDGRRDRQALLLREQDPLELHALVHEAALRTIVGSKEIMIAQLDHLLMMAKRPNITIQVVPFGTGAHGAMTGPWFLLSFPEPDEPDSAYAESRHRNRDGRETRGRGRTGGHLARAARHRPGRRRLSRRCVTKRRDDEQHREVAQEQSQQRRKRVCRAVHRRCAGRCS